MAYLSCTSLCVGYAGTHVAHNISFSMGAGDAVFVVGENGAGKSTLLKTVLGLLPPQAGELEFGDGVTAGEVGYLPQRSETQRDFPASGWEVALSGRASRLGRRHFYSEEDRAATEEALRRVDALKLKDAPFGSLSGGQQQRIMLARALAGAPKLLVLDEPTTGLDPEAAETLYRTIDELRADGVGVLSVTHDVAAGLSHATHVLEFARGTASFRKVQAGEQHESPLVACSHDGEGAEGAGSTGATDSPTATSDAATSTATSSASNVEVASSDAATATASDAASDAATDSASNAAVAPSDAATATAFDAASDAATDPASNAATVSSGAATTTASDAASDVVTTPATDSSTSVVTATASDAASDVATASATKPAADPATTHHQHRTDPHAKDAS